MPTPTTEYEEEDGDFGGREGLIVPNLSRRRNRDISSKNVERMLLNTLGLHRAWTVDAVDLYTRPDRR